jgi:transglutaminase-like putative cysteine protease
MNELSATEFLDHDSPEVREFVARVAATATSPAQRAVALYQAVRDGVFYEVYGADLSRAGLRASSVLRRGSGMCLHKSVLYAAALRAAGVPSRLVLTDARNHLASPRLRELIGGDVFRYHCLVSVRLAGKWVRATPVFNRTLCRLYRIAVLEFDGSADSVHHPFDLEGRRHMEFLHTHGEFADLPYDLVLDGLRAAHPRIFATADTFTTGSLVADAAR